jgi:hypothetical protein
MLKLKARIIFKKLNLKKSKFKRNTGITSFKNNFYFFEPNCNKIIFQTLIKNNFKNKNIKQFKILKIDNKSIRTDTIVELENNKTYRILKIFKFCNCIIFKVNQLELELEDLGIFYIVKNNTDNYEFINLDDIISIFNVFKKGERKMLVHKVYLFK